MNEHTKSLPPLRPQLVRYGKFNFDHIPRRQEQLDMFHDRSAEAPAQRVIHLQLIAIIACEIRRIQRGTA